MVVLAGVLTLLSAVPLTAARSTVASLYGGEKVACSKLKSKYPDNTFLPGTLGYAYETQERKHYLLGQLAGNLLIKHSVLVSDSV
jgi:hypothetical protein